MTVMLAMPVDGCPVMLSGNAMPVDGCPVMPSGNAMPVDGCPVMPAVVLGNEFP
jgi:hypothetical protein